MYKEFIFHSVVMFFVFSFLAYYTNFGHGILNAHIDSSMNSIGPFREHSLLCRLIFAVLTFFFVLPAGWKSIHRAALRSFGYQSDTMILKLHLLLQSGITLFLSFIISFIFDVNFFGYVISKAFFEITMSIAIWKIQAKLDWSNYALSARHRMNEDLP